MTLRPARQTFRTLAYRLRVRERAFRRVAGPFSMTEGPAWDIERKRVLFTDVPTSRILEFDPVSGACRTVHSDTRGSNGLALDREGRLCACEEAGRRVVRYERDGALTVLAERFDGARLNSPNDLVVDTRGSIWFTDPRYGPERGNMELAHESVYRLDVCASRAPKLTRVAFETVRPNGLALAPDERTLYVADSPTAPEGRRELRGYPIRDDRTLGRHSVLCEFGPDRGVDGLCLHPDGRIFATCGWRRGGPGPRIAVLAPDGHVVEELPLPVEPTNVCLAGDSGLFVTAKDGGLWHLDARL